MILNDTEISALAIKGMITPFQPWLIREVAIFGHGDMPGEIRKVLSYGLSSYGYDIRLSPKEFKIFKHIPGTVVNPKNFNPDNLQSVELQHDQWGEYFIIPAHSYGLGVALEKLEMPSDVTAICLGKSTYARVGLIANITPSEACMSDDTEILAKTGWKLLKDVILGEEVLTFNPETQKSEYQPITDKQSYYYNGDLLHFHSRFVDQLVTHQHRMWVGKPFRRVLSNAGDGRHDKVKGQVRESYKGIEWNFCKAGDIFGKWNYYLSRNVAWEGVNNYESKVEIGQYSIPIEYWCKFIGAWMGDGSAFIQNKGNYVVKLAVVTKDQKRAYFKSILDTAGIKYSEDKYGFTFRCKAICEYLLPYKGALNKYLPLDLKQLPPYLLVHIIEGMIQSDGNIETMTYCSSSKRLINDFQEIALKAGYNATIWEREGFSEFTNKAYKQYNCRISNADKYNKILPDSGMKKVPYTGMVYDVTVPNHIFLSRRNGRASWTGNSWAGHLTLEISNSSSADCRIYANEGICQLLFFRGEPCRTSYEDRSGKYQNQAEEITLPRI